MSPTDLARLRRIWPAVVKAKGAKWPPEPFGYIDTDDGDQYQIDGRTIDPYVAEEFLRGRLVVDLTLPGTRAAVLAWLGLPAWDMPIDSYQYMGDLRVNVRLPKEHTAATALAAIERWHEENGR